MLDISILKTAIANNNPEEIAKIIKQYNLILADGKIKADEKVLKLFSEYWDKRQQVKKLKLNGSYGSLLATSCRFFDQRLGQSTTLSGRQVVKHMTAKVNEIITGQDDYLGKSIIYNDSVVGDTMIKTSAGDMTIADLYDTCITHGVCGGKEYGASRMQVIGFNLATDVPVMANIRYVMRHHTSKHLYKTTLANGKHVITTEDHSLMVDRSGVILEVKPTEIQDTDLFIVLIDSEMKVERVGLKSVECLGEVADYVYDISIIGQDHVFFANDCLVHNTDSCTADTIIKSNFGELPIVNLFNAGSRFWSEETEYGIKEYSSSDLLKVATFDQEAVVAYYAATNYVYRHKVSKEKWQITDEHDNAIVVTGDHSVMIDRDDMLLEIRACEMTLDDVLLTLHTRCSSLMHAEKTNIKSITKLDDFVDEYVYDIGMKNEDRPWFFGNNILIHNSVYFSAYETLKPDIDAGLIPWDRESVIELYDKICDLVNDSFVGFMKKQFNCPEERGIVIKAGREVVASKAMFITKKRYAALVYDKEGKRKDKDGKIGEIKITGLDIKRSDTPYFVQQFLAEIIEMVLTGIGEVDVLRHIIKFRAEFNERPGWEKGSPKRANNITNYREKEEIKGKITIPGHVRASINWNTLKEMHDDKYSAHIIDGSKVVVCKLKPNYTGFKSVAYPVDEPRLPQWFKDLPFDHGGMEDAIIDKKISNLIGVLNWDLLSTDQNVEVSSLFNFKGHI
jgi:hypothetical protein